MKTKFELVWQQRLDELEQFIKSEGRMPSRRVEEPHERTLGEWLGKQRDRITGDRAAALDALSVRVGLDWRAKIYQTFEDRVAELEVFHLNHGRWPRQSVEDLDAHSLARFLSKLRLSLPAIGPHTIEQQRRLDVLDALSERTSADWRPPPPPPRKKEPRSAVVCRTWKPFTGTTSAGRASTRQNRWSEDSGPSVTIGISTRGITRP